MNKKVAFGCCGIGLLLVGGVIAAVLAVILLGPVATLKPRETAAAVGPERILSMDFDREAGVLYYVLERVGGNALLRHALATDEREVIHTQSPHAVSWVSVSRRGTVFVLDSGNNPFDLPWVKMTTPAHIVELQRTTVVGTIPILSPTALSQKVSRQDRTPESTANGCAMVVADSVTQTPLGVDRVDRVLRLSGAKVPSRAPAGGNAFVPKFLVLGSSSAPDVAVSVEGCGVELFQRFAARAVRENLSHLNEAVIADTLASRDALVAHKSADFTFKSVSKGLGYFNFPCEKYYDQIAWGRSKYNMGSCAQGIIGFAQSYDVFTPDGDFLYYRWRGIYRMSR